MTANLNILTDKECKYLLGSKSKEKRKLVAWNEKYEFCVGKKHSLPRKMLAFRRRKKKKETIEEEKASAKKCM